MSAEDKIGRFRRWWKNVRKTSGYRNVLLYLIFVGIAFLFWLILSLNNNIQDTLTVKVRFYNVPDSVTFLQDPPTEFHLNVRDKGTSLLRNGAVRPQTLNINFKEYSKDGVLRFTSSDLYASLRNLFGNNAQLTSLSIDSIHLDYTSSPGKKVPVQVVYDITAATGKMLASAPVAVPSRVEVFSKSNVVDTLTRVFTANIVRRDLIDPTEVEVQLVPVPGVKIVPSKVKVKINVDALIKKSVRLPIKVADLPSGESVLLYPDHIMVEYYVPMTHFNEDNNLQAFVNYSEFRTHEGNKAKVEFQYPSYCVNLTHNTDSVEYTLFK